MLRPLALNSLLLLISSCIAGLLAEIVCAVVVPCTLVKHDILLRNPLDENVLPVVRLGNTFDFEKNANGHQYTISLFRYQYHIGELATRGTSVPAKGTFKILVLGDSQTFGMGVGDAESFSAQLERTVKAINGRPLQVFNAGVPGYSTCDEVWKAARLTPQIKPDLIVVGFFGDNALVPTLGPDLYGNDHCAERNAGTRNIASVPLHPAKKWLGEHSHIYSLLSHAIRIAKRTPDYDDMVANYRKDKTNEPSLERAWDKTRVMLKELRELSETSGAKSIVFYLPSATSLKISDDSSVDELKKSGLPVASSYSDLKAALDQAHGNLGKIFFGDGHFNQKSHLLLAENLARFLQTEMHLDLDR